MKPRRLSREDEQFRQILFDKWTVGLSQVEQRVSIFSHIRDIPYAIVPEWRDLDDDIIRLMVTENRGWCGPKHILLIWMFERLKIQIEPVYIPFRWQDQQVMYPSLLRKILPYLSDTVHLCCRAYLNETWQIIDVTWDLPLKSVGFPVNELWDGVSGTTPAVTSINSAEKKQKIYQYQVVPPNTIDFIPQFNLWLEVVRSQKKG